MAGSTPPAGAHVTYSRQFKRCTRPSCPTCRPGLPGHGPYWYAHWRENGRLRSHYYGKMAPDGAVEAAVRPDAQAVAALRGLRVRTLGGFEVWRGETAIPAAAWSRRDVVALFTCLLGMPHQRAPREYLVEALWPEEDPAVSARKMRQALYHLRRVLDDPDGDAPYVHADGTVVALTSTVGGADAVPWVDAAAFEQAAIGALAGQDAGASRAAVALYTGDYLPDALYEEWATVRRESLRALYLSVLLHLAALRERDGVASEAIRCLRTALEVDPCHEPAARGLMRLQAAAGHRAEALRTYQRVAEALRRDLALAPDTQTQALAEHLQAARAGGAAPRGNLPTPITSFQGRREELAALATVLVPAGTDAAADRADARRLITLTGLGGCGKTRLAIELGHELASSFTGGVWLVELAALRDPALIAPAICRVLDIPEDPQRGALTALSAALGTRHLLLILDNCEHLLDGCAQVAAAVLGACPRLRIVATSREAVGMLGETVWPVAPLSVIAPAALSTDADVTAYAAVELFVQRARAVRPGFALTPANRRVVTEVCYRLDGLPLAIELATARLSTLSVEQVAARLDDRFMLLSAGNRAALPRHQTLRAAMEWSYALLDERAQVLLRRLAVFAGGWTLEAAEVACGGDTLPGPAVLDALSQLVAKSLVTVDERGEQPRYRLLETVRDFAQSVAASAGELEHLRSRHLEWCHAFAAQAVPLLRGPLQGDWWVRLDAEHDNFRAALQWASTTGAVEAGLRLACALGSFWHWRGHLREGRMWLDRLLAALRDRDLSGDQIVAVRGRALTMASNLAYRQNDFAASTALLEEGLALARGQGDVGKQMMSAYLNSYGLLLREQGDYARALEMLTASMALDEELGDTSGVVTSLSNQGWVAHAQGDYGRAMALYAEGLRRAREMGHTLLIGVVLGNQAHTAWALGDDARAAALYRETLTLAHQFGLPWGCAICLEGLGRVAARQGETERAARWWGAAEAIRAGVNAPLSESDRRAYNHDESVAAVRAALGEARFVAAWEAGAALCLEQACAEALE